MLPAIEYDNKKGTHGVMFTSVPDEKGIAGFAKKFGKNFEKIMAEMLNYVKGKETELTEGVDNIENQVNEIPINESSTAPEYTPEMPYPTIDSNTEMAGAGI